MRNGSLLLLPPANLVVPFLESQLHTADQVMSL